MTETKAGKIQITRNNSHTSAVNSMNLFQFHTFSVHQCLFCPQTFGSAAAKDDHVLEHFAQEICLDCDQTLIRIGDKLYIVHEGVTCVRRELKLEENDRMDFGNQAISSTMEYHQQFDDIKIEPILIANELSNTIENQVQSSDMELNEIESTQTNTNAATEQNNMDFNFEQQPNVLDEEIQIKIEPTTLQDRQEDSLMYEIDSVESESEDESESKTETESKAIKSNCQPAVRSKNRSLVCELCGKTLSGTGPLRRHKIVVHGARGEHFCRICSRLFEAREQLDVHRLECVAKKRMQQRKLEKIYVGTFECEICKTIFKHRSLYRKHMRTQHFMEFKCDSCDLKFSIESDYKNHARQCKRPDFACDVCGKVFCSRNAFQQHKLIQHSGKIYCKMCHKKFATLEEMTKHRSECVAKKRDRQRLKRDNSLGVFKCSLCSSILSSQVNLNAHMKRLHDPNYLKFKCNSCGARFVNEDSFKRHVCREKLTVFSCDSCDKILSSRFGMSKHKLLVHNPKGTHFCKICYKKFASKEEQAEHEPDCVMKKRSRSRTEFQNSIGRFECDICHSIFKARRYLGSHMRKTHQIFKSRPQMNQ